MERSSRAIVIAITMSITGCSSAGRLVTSPGEYSSYRETRVASNLDARMGASFHYLQAYPEGAFYEEVERFFERAEPLYFDVRKTTKAGLVAYLDALPEGPHAEEARQRLLIFERRDAR